MNDALRVALNETGYMTEALAERVSVDPNIGLITEVAETWS